MISDKRVFQVLGLSTILFFSQCGLNGNKEQVKEEETGTATTIDSNSKEQPKETPKEKKEEKEDKAISTGYSAYPIKGVDSAVKVFKKKYSPEEQYTILALNRLDVKHIGRADTLVIPDKLATDLMSYSPYPASVESLNDIPKIIFFSYPVQAFGAYEHGKLVYWGPTSMGSKIHKTPTGLHFANWKGRQIISTVNDEWKLNWNFNIANKDGVGWHEYDLPGYPASHSCLRLLADQAKWLYDWGNQWILDKQGKLLANGTPVVVFGEYPWGGRRPWKNLLDNPEANVITEKDMTDLVQPYLEKIKAEQERRAQVEANKGTAQATASVADTSRAK
jgi:hypothetical protein